MVILHVKRSDTN